MANEAVQSKDKIDFTEQVLIACAILKKAGML